MSVHTPGNALRNAPVEDECASITGCSVARGDERMRVFMSTYHTMVWRTVRNLGVSNADLDDAVQQVFIIASSKLHLISDGCERSFLAGVAVRIASRSRRSRERRREAIEIDPADQPATCASPVEELDRVEARRIFERLLDLMPPDLQLAFVMYEVEELTLAEIAAALALPLGTVASRVRRARELFVTRARRLDGCTSVDGGRR